MILAAFSANSNAQENSFYQNWVMNEVFNCEGQKLTALQESYWNLKIQDSSTATITIKGSKLETQKEYQLDQDQLKFDYQSYKIEHLSQNELILLKEGKNCIKYIFITEQENERQKQRVQDNLVKQSEKFFIYKQDTVYFANKFNGPKMKRYHDHKEYFITSYPNLGNTEPCIIEFKFIVKKDGSLQDAVGNISCLRKPEKKVSKIIAGMENSWTPMIINGKPVNSLMRVKINYN